MKNKKDLIVDLIASGFRSGYAPIASGTFGTLVAIPFVVVLKIYFSEVVFAVCTLLLLLISIPIANRAEKLYGENDSSKIVIDEIVGFFVSCMFLRILSWDTFAFAFFAFRAFDIFKFWPASYFDKKPGGFSVIMDDVVAGVYTNLSLQIYCYLRITLFVAFKVGSAGG